MNADLDDDDLPPFLGEALRDFVLLSALDDAEEPLKPKRGAGFGQSHNMGLLTEGRVKA